MANLDDGWKPNGRPQSTIARSFSAALDNAFALSPELENLSTSVALKQKAVSSQKDELSQLEARLREAEERLKERQSAQARNPNSTSGRSSPRQRQGLDGVFNQPNGNAEQFNGSGFGRNGRSPLVSPKIESSQQTNDQWGGAVHTSPNQLNSTGFSNNLHARNLVHQGFDAGQMERRQLPSRGKA